MNIVKKYNLDKLRFVALLVLALQLSSCNDFLDNDNEFYHVATQEQQWNSLTDTRAALFGVYGLMRSALGENNTYWAVEICVLVILQFGCGTICRQSVIISWMKAIRLFSKSLIGDVFIK